MEAYPLARHLWLHAPRVAVDFFLAILTLIGVKAVEAEFKGEIKDFYIRIRYNMGVNG